MLNLSTKSNHFRTSTEKTLSVGIDKKITGVL